MSNQRRMPVTVRCDTDSRDNAGRFKAGNPGKPKGARSHQAAALRDAMKDELPNAMAALREQLAQGNWKAISWVLDRFIPAERIPALQSTDASDLGRAIVDGELTPSEAQKLAVAFKAVAEADQLRVLMERLDEVERLLQQGAHKR